MIDNNIPTAIITVQGTAVVYDSSLWWADYLTITTEPDGVTVILDTDHNINLSVSSGHNVTAILKGDGNGNAVAEVYGQAIRQGNGNGNAISHGGGQSVRQGSGDGDAVSYDDGQTVRQGSGNGNATSHGGGQAVRQGSGDGDAVSYGDGEALKSGRGVGRAIQLPQKPS